MTHNLNVGELHYTRPQDGILALGAEQIRTVIQLSCRILALCYIVGHTRRVTPSRQDGGLAKKKLRVNNYVQYLDAFAIAATVALPASRILGSESWTRRMVALVKRESEKDAYHQRGEKPNQESVRIADFKNYIADQP